MSIALFNIERCKCREENQLDATECFIALIICSTCFGHPPSGTRRYCVQDEGDCATQSHNLPHPGHIACCPACNSRPPATKTLHTTCGNNTSIVSSSWWWAYKCTKHIEQIISAIKHSVAFSWFSSLRLYYDAQRHIHQKMKDVFNARCILCWSKT